VLIVGPIVIGVVAGLVLGGRMSNWSEVHLRWPWVVVVVLAVRLGVAATPLGTFEWLRFVYVASVVGVIGWTLLNVDRLFGIWLVSLGSLTNLVVICANDFRMPIAAPSTSLLAKVGHYGQYVFMDAHTRLNWLGDWMGVSGPVGGVFSPGDVLIGVGLGVVSFAITRFPGSPSKLDVSSAQH
jgi:Family of unknown function (DUF5317)